MMMCNDDGTVTFSGNVDAPNMLTEDRVREIINEMLPETYTKDEIDSKLALKADSANVYTKEQTYDRDTIDEKIAGGGGGGGTTDYNQLSNRPIVDGVVQSGLDMNGNSITKLYTIDAANNNFTVSNPLAFKVGEWLTVHNDQDITVNITTEKGLHINAPSILLNGEIENVYTKSASDARVRELFAELMNRAVQIQTLNTKNILLYPKGSEGWSGDVTGGIYVTGSTVDDMRMLIGAGDAYISVTRDTTTFDTPNAVFGIRPYNINVSRDTESDKIIVQSEQKPLEIKAPSITFTGTLENVYTKAECDEKFSGGGGTVPDPLNIGQVTAGTLNGTNSKIQYLDVYQRLTLKNSTDSNIYTKDDIKNFGLGSIITAWSGLDRLLISTQTEIQKLFIGMEGESSDMVFRYIQASNAYPEIGRVKNDTKELQLSEYRLNATRGITTNELYVSGDVNINGSFGSKLSVNTYNQSSTVTGDYNGLISVGGSENTATTTAARTSGYAAIGGALNKCDMRETCENSGILFVGGAECNCHHQRPCQRCCQNHHGCSCARRSFVLFLHIGPPQESDSSGYIPAAMVRIPSTVRGPAA